MATAANGSERSFLATYVDTADRRLARAGIPLRRRVEKGQSIWEARIGETTLSEPGGPAHVPEGLQRTLSALLRGDDVVQVARVRRGADDVAVLEGQRVIASYPDVTGALEHTLAAPRRDSAPRKDAPAIEHVRSYLRAQLRAIERHDPAVRVGSDPEDLHKLRVAVRRSRAALRAAGPLLGDEDARALRNELKWLGGQLGPARDLDVLLVRLRAEVADLDEPDATAAAKIVQQLESARTAAQSDVLAALESPRYAQLVETLAQTIAVPRVTASDMSLGKVARSEFKKLERHVEALGDEPSNEALHRARIQAKRLRYATELSAAALGKDGRRVVDAAKVLQDAAGAHQDAVVAEERIRNAARRARAAGAGVAAGRLIERERARRADARTSVTKAWKRLRPLASAF